MQIGKMEFDTDSKTYVMGILNVTPDSFSDGGKYQEQSQALRQAERMMKEGADILDIGGESTRPGHTRISEEEEIARIMPVLSRIKQEFEVPISIDTAKAGVAKAALAAGADMINDIWGLKGDKKMAAVIANAGAVCCLMHNRKHTDYQNLREDIKQDLQESITLARQAGIKQDKIVLDPGIGFAKTYQNNLETVFCLEEFHQLGYPLLLGTSRKSFIGQVLELPVEERIEGTLTTTVLAVLKGCAFVRVHDIKENIRAICMAEALRDGWRQHG